MAKPADDERRQQEDPVEDLADVNRDIRLRPNDAYAISCYLDTLQNRYGPGTSGS